LKSANNERFPENRLIFKIFVKENDGINIKDLFSVIYGKENSFEYRL